MARKPKEEEQEIDLQKKEKRTTYAVRWFNDYAVNNREELKIICDITAREAEEQFSMIIRSGNTEVYALIFYVTFMSILEFIKKQQKHRNNFTIEIAKSINIGYTNNSDEDNEKVGNFMPILEYIGVNRPIVRKPDLERTASVENPIEWMHLNAKSTISGYKEIQMNAFEKLKSEYGISLRTEECVIPLFCIFIDNVTKVCKQKFNELQGTGVSEISIDVLGLFTAYYSYDADSDNEVYEYTPDITTKLALKQDDCAARED